MDSASSLIVQTNLPRRFFARLPQLVIDSDLQVTGYPTLDAYLKKWTPETDDPRSANWWGNYSKYMATAG